MRPGVSVCVFIGIAGDDCTSSTDHPEATDVVGDTALLARLNLDSKALPRKRVMCSSSSSAWMFGAGLLLCFCDLFSCTFWRSDWVTGRLLLRPYLFPPFAIISSFTTAVCFPFLEDLRFFLFLAAAATFSSVPREMGAMLGFRSRFARILFVLAGSVSGPSTGIKADWFTAVRGCRKEKGYGVSGCCSFGEVCCFGDSSCWGELRSFGEVWCFGDSFCLVCRKG
mmetsp:Transcript_37651/g.50972  ORF Transcript_37651/g.50972 Transcript_37651/m.50972 type:complete len:225 (+) Transcript_37651:286-960(+)